MKWLIKWVRKLPHKHDWKYDSCGHRRECSFCKREEWLLLFVKDNYYEWTTTEESNKENK